MREALRLAVLLDRVVYGIRRRPVLWLAMAAVAAVVVFGEWGTVIEWLR